MSKQKIADRLAKIIWNYSHLNQPLQKADCIIVLGSYDLRVAERGAEIFLQGYAPWIMFSGNLGRYTKGEFKKSEAETFAEIAKKMGVPADKIILEDRSSNTSENIKFSISALKQKGLNCKKYILVQKPYMERRVYATFKKLFPKTEMTVTSPQLDYEQYVSQGNKERHLNAMVGDLQRIKVYAEKGFQIPQKIPPKVWAAYNELARLGYNKSLI